MLTRENLSHFVCFSLDKFVVGLRQYHSPFGVFERLRRSSRMTPSVTLFQRVFLPAFIQVSGQKRSRYIKTSPSRNFHFAEASLMYRPCISQAPKEMYLCAIQLLLPLLLPFQKVVLVYHIELMFVNTFH